MSKLILVNHFVHKRIILGRIKTINLTSKLNFDLMCRFMLIFDILKHGSSTLNFNSSDNIARIIKCDISKSKLALSTCNGVSNR